MKKVLYSIVAVVISLAIAAAVPAISASTISVIKGCVNKKTQVLRIASKCTSSEKAISWNAKGEKGEKGLQGLPGATGSSGSTGATGATGAEGASGSGGLGFDIFDASANVIRDTGATGRPVVLDANGNLFGYPLNTFDSGWSRVSNPSSPNLLYRNGLGGQILTYATILIASTQQTHIFSMLGYPDANGVEFRYPNSECSGTPFLLYYIGNPTDLLELRDFRLPRTVSGSTTWYRTVEQDNRFDTFLSVSRADGICTQQTWDGGQYGPNYSMFSMAATRALVPTPVGPLRIVVQ